MKLDRHFCSITANVPDKFQSYQTVLNTNHAVSRHHKILQFDVLLDIESSPECSFLCMLAPCLSCDRCGAWDVMDCHRQEITLCVGSVFVLWQMWSVRCHGLSQAGDTSVCWLSVRPVTDVEREMSWTVTGRRYLCMLAPCLSCDRYGAWDVMDSHRQEIPLYVGSVLVLWQMWSVRCHGLSQAGYTSVCWLRVCPVTDV